MDLPSDDFILLSLINTKLRDEYSSLKDLCEEEGVDLQEICTRLNGAGFSYDEELNAFK